MLKHYTPAQVLRRLHGTKSDRTTLSGVMVRTADKEPITREYSDADPTLVSIRYLGRQLYQYKLHNRSRNAVLWY